METNRQDGWRRLHYTSLANAVGYQVHMTDVLIRGRKMGRTKDDDGSAQYVDVTVLMMVRSSLVG